jgi:predicted homoserine dehydrogenase-like protein
LIPYHLPTFEAPNAIARVVLGGGLVPPLGGSVVDGCPLLRNIREGAVIRYDDVELPSGRLADRLRAEQYHHFRGESWLEERLLVALEPSCSFGEVSAGHSRADLPSGRHSV